MKNFLRDVWATMKRVFTFRRSRWWYVYVKNKQRGTIFVIMPSFRSYHEDSATITAVERFEAYRQQHGREMDEGWYEVRAIPCSPPPRNKMEN